MIRVPVLFSKAAAHTRFLNENSCWFHLFPWRCFSRSIMYIKVFELRLIPLCESLLQLICPDPRAARPLSIDTHLLPTEHQDTLTQPLQSQEEASSQRCLVLPLGLLRQKHLTGLRPCICIITRSFTFSEFAVLFLPQSPLIRSTWGAC